MAPMDHSEITVIVQGPVVGGADDHPDDRLTYWCLESIRRHLHGARIVLSTWDGSDVDGLDYDDIILNTDPGGVPLFLSPRVKVLNNVNRQIVTTKAGMRLCSSNYVLKLRSDLALGSSGFLDYFGKFEKCDERYRYLSSKVLTCSLFARNPRRYLTPMPYHPSDWVFFGRTEDVRDIWDIDLVDEGELNWFSEDNRCPNRIWRDMRSRFFPEQFLWTRFLRKHCEITCDHLADIDQDNLEHSDGTLVSNLVILSLKQLGMDFLKDTVKQNHAPHTTYTHREWLMLYNKICGGRVAVGYLDKEKLGRFQFQDIVSYIARRCLGRLYRVVLWLGGIPAERCKRRGIISRK